MDRFDKYIVEAINNENNPYKKFNLLNEFLKSYEKNFTHEIESAIKILPNKHPQVKVWAKKRMLRQFRTLKNKARGYFGEFYGQIFLEVTYGITTYETTIDKKIFETPYGKRRIDVFWDTNKLALESKMGKVF